MIYLCTRCNYLFESEETPERCPDCGKLKIVPAKPDEQEEYHRNRRLFDAMERDGD